MTAWWLQYLVGSVAWTLVWLVAGVAAGWAIEEWEGRSW